MTELNDVIDSEIQVVPHKQSVGQCVSEASELSDPEMKNFIGVKLVQAKPMTLGAYNDFKGWTIPENEDPNREGYLVKYDSDYISWCPKEVFEKHNLEILSNIKIDKPDVLNYVSQSTVYTKNEDETPIVAVYDLIDGSELSEYVLPIQPLAIAKAKMYEKVESFLSRLLLVAKNGFNNPARVRNR